MRDSFAIGFNVSLLEIRNGAGGLSVTVKEMKRRKVYPYIS
jgi:hypothetical protein